MKLVLRNISRKAIVPLLAVLLIAATAISSTACYSGLGVIPTADVIEPGRYGVELQIDGRLDGVTSDTRVLDFEYGLCPRIEAGIDFDISTESDSRELLNAKCQLLSDSGSTPAFAVGVCNVGKSIKSSPYAVATHDFTALRSHLGLMRIDGNNRWFVGIDRAITDKITCMADYTNGSDNFASLGGSYQFNQHIGVLAAIMLPNDNAGDTGYTLHFVFN